MALGALAANPDCGLKIVPCGMNYFHAHKFRSRAVIEFGNPIEVSNELVELYKKGEKREAVRSLLEIIYEALVSVTVISPDYDTLMVCCPFLSAPRIEVANKLRKLVQAVRRLYKPAHKKLPLPMVVELNRRLVKGYTQYKDDQRIIDLKKSIANYNKQLHHLGLRDHQVEYAKFSIPKVIFTLFYRLGKLAVMAIGTLPGLVLFAPVFIATKTISIKKSREALAASTVKIQGRDVMATWKLLVALALAPILYAFYTALLTWWTFHNRVQGLIPEWVPPSAVVVFGMVFFPSITFAALRFGETGMDIIKSLRPLTLSLNPTSANTLVKLRETRQRLSFQVTEAINTLGPEVFPDFDSARIIADPFRDGAYPTSFSPPRVPRRDSELSSYEDEATSPTTRTTSHDANHLPRNESFGNLGSIGLFATRPPSRSRSRSSSAGGSSGFPIKGFSTMVNSKEGFDEVSKRIRGAMAERGKERSRRRSGLTDGEGDYSEESEPVTPQEGKKDL
jgi:glycerol-3-phosphate O-acyltransferase/dihydroxyacetone phosphate acyltransferase